MTPSSKSKLFKRSSLASPDVVIALVSAFHTQETFNAILTIKESLTSCPSPDLGGVHARENQLSAQTTLLYFSRISLCTMFRPQSPFRHRAMGMVRGLDYAPSVLRTGHMPYDSPVSTAVMADLRSV